jgi:hypothetical protein
MRSVSYQWWVYAFVYPTIVAWQMFGKDVPAALKKRWMLRFLCGRCLIKGKETISSSQSLLFNTMLSVIWNMTAGVSETSYWRCVLAAVCSDHALYKRKDESGLFWGTGSLLQMWNGSGGTREHRAAQGRRHKSVTEECYNAVYSVESQPTFRKNISPSCRAGCLTPAFKLVSCSTVFDLENVVHMFLRNVGWLSNGLHGVLSQKTYRLHL